jgi:hypothetical protein
MSGGNSVVESLPSKQMVAGSSPVPRSILQGQSEPGEVHRGNGRVALSKE